VSCPTYSGRDTLRRVRLIPKGCLHQQAGWRVVWMGRCAKFSPLEDFWVKDLIINVLRWGKDGDSLGYGEGSRVFFDRIYRIAG